MKLTRLGEVAEIVRDGIAPEKIVAGTPYLGLEHIESGGRIISSDPVADGELASTKFQFGPEHLLYGKLRPYLAKIALPDFAGICSTDILPVKAGPDLDKRYLAHFLRQPRMVDFANSRSSGANLPRLSPKALADFQIPLPPLPEQRRIAEILDQADALRRLRRQSLSRLSDLGQAIFYEMFGDTNQDRSSAYNAIVGDVCIVSSGSTPSRKVEGYYGGSIPWVKTTEVKGGPISSVEEFITEAGRAAARLKTYPVKTILVAMYGQGRTRGNVGYLTFPASVNQACAALQCNERCLPEFMFFQLKSSYERLRRLGQGGNQPNLNAEIVRSFPIVLPTIERQSAFLKIFNDIRESENHLREHEKQVDTLFTSLQHRAFSGEL